MNEKTRAKLLNDPLYGPGSPFFWPGTVLHAEDFAWSTDYNSTKDFLENSRDDYSGVEGYIENTEDPEEEYIDQLYAHFHKLYDGVESWPYHTFVASGFYRVVFHEVFPYQSKWYEITKRSEFDDIERFCISKGLYDEAISSLSFQSLEETQQDKETDKVGGRISYSTWRHFIRVVIDPDSDPLVCQELIRLVKQYNLTDGYSQEIKKAILLRFEGFSCGRLLEPSDTKAFMTCLSLLRIPTEKIQEAMKKSLAEKSYVPLMDLVQTHG